MSQAHAWRVLRAIALWTAILCVTACAVNDGGIVGTGNRPDCSPGTNPRDCKPAGTPATK